jgi:hypothetical protein
MLGALTAKLGLVFKSKVGIALMGALVLGGGGSAMAMASSHGQFFSDSGAPGTAPSATAHHDESSNATKVAGKGDQEDETCSGNSGGATASPTAHSDDSSDGTRATTSPTAHAESGDASSATQVAGHDDQDETQCQSSGESTHAAHTPEPTERPEGTHAPEPTPSSGHGGD